MDCLFRIQLHSEKEDRMVWVGLGATAGFLISIIIIFHMTGDFFPDLVSVFLMGFLGIFVWALFTATFGVIGLGISVGVGAIKPAPYEFEGRVELAALRDTAGIEGRVFLSTSYIGTSYYYIFYQRNANGELRLEFIHPDNTVIFEEDREDAFIDIHGKDNIRLFAIEFASDRYEIHVPKGSVLKEFQLGLK